MPSDREPTRPASRAWQSQEVRKVERSLDEIPHQKECRDARCRSAASRSRRLRSTIPRYRATFSQWRAFTANDLYGNTTGWVGAVNGAGTRSVSPAYQRATIPVLTYSQADLNAINATDAQNLKSVYASLEL